MTDELISGGVTVSVPDADGVMHEMTLTIGEPITETPDPEPQMGGEGEQVADERTVFEVVNDMTERVAGIVADAFNGAAPPAPTPPEPIAPPAPTPPANMMSAAELAEYDSETVRLVSSQESAVCQLESDLASLKDEIKAAKKAVETAKEELRELIQNRDRQRGRKPVPSLFDSPAHAAPADDATTTNRVDADNATDQVNDPHAELWREYPMTVANWKPFGLTAKDVERLNSGETKNSGVHPITKLGDVTRFITPNPDSPAFTRTLIDFKGMGEAAYDRWLEAEQQFWIWWNSKGGKAKFIAERAGANAG